MKKSTAEVRLDYMNKDLSFDPSNVGVKPGDIVVVETDYGLDMGLLTEFRENREVDEKQLPLKRILRLANEDDVTKQNSLTEKEGEAFKVCEEEIMKAKLDMKLVSARFSFDASRVTFCYTAESRVDFRELVKTLASRLQTRIELRQVGVRDEARLFGGFGPCGRRLCCSAFLRDFKSVSIKMAKEQGLPLNPMKISGICGRLFCCLKYEYDEYVQLRKLMPHYGETIEKGDVKGRIVKINVLKRTVTVATDGGGWAEVDIDVPEEKLKCTCGTECCKEQDRDSNRRRDRRKNDRKGNRKKQEKDNRAKDRDQDEEQPAKDNNNKEAANNEVKDQEKDGNNEVKDNVKENGQDSATQEVKENSEMEVETTDTQVSTENVEQNEQDSPTQEVKENAELEVKTADTQAPEESAEKSGQDNTPANENTTQDVKENTDQEVKDNTEQETKPPVEAQEPKEDENQGGQDNATQDEQENNAKPDAAPPDATEEETKQQ